MRNPRWWPRNGSCDGRSMARILTMKSIQVNLVSNPWRRQHNSPELSLLKFLPLSYHHNHFLAITLDFTSFSSWIFGLYPISKLGCDDKLLKITACIQYVSYSTIVLYSRDHKGVGMAHKNITQKTALLFPDDDEAVLVR